MKTMIIFLAAAFGSFALAACDMNVRQGQLCGPGPYKPIEPQSGKCHQN